MEIARTDEERAFQETLRRFCDQEVAPHARAVDRGERSLWETYRALGRMELLAPCFPEQYGGAGCGLSMLAVQMSELSRACGSTALSCGASVMLGGGTLARFGSDQQRERWLPGIASGEAIACLGLTEPGAGSDVQSLRTRAQRDGDGWVVSGSKTFITNAVDADLFLIYAVTGEEGGRNTLGTFVVEKGAAGLSTGEPMEKLGMRGSPTSEVNLDAVRVPAADVLGQPTDGWTQAMWPLTHERAIASAVTIGLLQGCIERCVRYVGERVQFGRPIGTFQAIQLKLARMRADQVMVTALLHAVLDGLASGADVRTLVSAGKIHAGEAAVRGALDAIQILGGYGYMAEYEVERALRDAKLLEIGAGTTEIQLLVIAREMLGDLAR